MDNNKGPGDAEFEKFIEDNSGSPIHGLWVVIKAISEKMDFIQRNYEATLNAYQALSPNESDLKVDLKSHIKNLIKISTDTMNQLDYAVMAFDEDDDENEDDDEEEKDPLKGL